MIVWLAEYPRCGVTFLRTVLETCFGVQTYSIYKEVRPKGLPHRKWPEEANGDPVSFVKTHFPIMWKGVAEEHLGPGPDDRCILLVRDGRDAIVSQARLDAAANGTLMSETIAGLSKRTSFADCAHFWLQGRENMVALRFEDLVNDPVAMVAKALDIIRVDCDTDGSPPTFSELHEQDPVFFARGRSGAWREHMTPTDEETWWNENGSTMESLGYER